MFDTMYQSNGVGLAAPQVGLSIRLFIVDGNAFEEDEVKDFKKVFINPSIKTDSQTGTSSVTFFAADLPGLYRVIVEGITSDGQPVRGEAYITIEEKQ